MSEEGFDLRPIGLADAEALAAAYTRNREHLRPWDPDRAEMFYTTEGQRESVQAQLRLIDEGRLLGWVLWLGDKAVGRIAMNNITRGVAQSATIGYWVDHEAQGMGLAKVMVGFAVEQATQLGLHRLEAGTMVDNAASQAVLRASGFEQYGTARDYLFLAGAWRDHHLWQRVLHDRPVLGGFL